MCKIFINVKNATSRRHSGIAANKKAVENGNVLKNGWWIIELKFVKCSCQPEGETSSGGDQLVSNKVDAYTKRVAERFVRSAITFW